MFKKTPCYRCNRPERLPNCLCQKDCKIHADYMAEKAEYLKQKEIERGLNSYTEAVIKKSKRLNIYR